ncbi:lipase family protein [Nocardiopsis sp. NPDC055551]
MEHQPRTPGLRRTAAVACTAGALGAVLALQPVAAVADMEPSVTQEPTDVEVAEALEDWEELDQPEADSPEARNDFYLPPDPLPQGEPGDVIRAEPSEAYTAPLGVGQFDADVWRVMYLSTNAMGEPMAVTGTVMVPDAEWEGEGERPLVSYAIGTHGLGSHCAPSIGLEQGLDYEASMMKNVIDQGHALVVTDYEGLGTPSPHTYMVGHSQGAAVLDGLRAATRMDELDISAEAPMGVSGFSQGGGASVWAGQMQPDYAPELPLAGVAAGGVPADLTQVADQLDGSLYFAFVGFTAYGFAAAYPELSFEEHLTEKGQRLLDASVDGCMIEALTSGAGMTMDETVDVDLINSPEWQARLLENKPGESVPEAPLYLYHSSGDDVIPIEQGEELRDAYCAGGASVEWRRTFSGPHLTSFFLDTQRAQDWLSGRLAGEPDSSTC